MSFKTRLKITFFSLLLLIYLPLKAGKKPILNKEIITACVLPYESEALLAQRLGWEASQNNLCGGAYRSYEQTFVKGFKLTADEISLALKGRSTVKGNVQVLHGNKALSADLAHIYRVNGKIKTIELRDHLVFNEPYHRILAKKGRFLVQDYSGTMSELLYRITLDDPNNTLLSRLDPLTAWGKACLAKRDPKGNITLSKVTYSTCPPGNNSWELKAKEINLLKKESKGIAKDVFLSVKGLPLVYLPYLSFPLDTQRKSGFIGSELALTSQNGFDYQFPYYLNLAPNIDATLYPHYLSRRGLMLGSEFRYLYGPSNGTIEGHFLAKDKAFKTFKASNLWIAPQLATLSDNRYSFKWLHNSQLTPALTLSIDWEAVSDDYYLQDFSNNLSVVSDNQLLRKVALTYQTEHWIYRAIAEEYQTLHPFNQSTTVGVYAKLPSVMALGHYDELPFAFHLNMATQVDNFKWQGENALTTPEGLRFSLLPTLNWRLEKEGKYIEPKVTLHSRFYDLKHYNAQSKTKSRIIPIASLDMGAHLDKTVFNGWLQTLEPRFYYLYVPFSRQSDIPLFDTASLLPSYNQLFRSNRFSGLDRVGDANQLSFGVSTRLIDPLGLERLKLSMGAAYKLRREQVFACQDLSGTACKESSTQFGYSSPDVGFSPTEFEADMKLSNQISVLSNVAIDFPHKQINNALINFHYEPKENHIINAGFGFILNGDPTSLTNVSDLDINLKQFRLSYAWPYSAHWRSIGAWSYNLSHNFSTSHLMGLQYDDCCIAMRFLGGRVYRNYNSNGAPVYGNNVYIQVLLKGLGSAANNDPSGVIRNFLPTFKDDFK